MYRGPDGSKCAAGLFIPDELYNPEMENLTFTMLNSQYHLGLSLEKKQFITNMQVIHDIGASNHSETFHQYVKEQMEIYARQYDLAIPTS
jgi:bisphosphoglycerate-dependent phosphoglycerate mutase